jgi:preprotein translocase subunit SecA
MSLTETPVGQPLSYQQLVAQLPASAPRRLGSTLGNRLASWIGLPWKRRLARAALAVPRIRYWEAHYGDLPETAFRQHAKKLRGRARGGEKLDRLLPEVFGMVCVASARLLRLRPFDVQLAAAVIMAQGGLAELATGEGKTLCALLPAALFGLQGKGVHVATVNEYLARRDAEFGAPVFDALGLNVAVLRSKMTEIEKFKAYRHDITYGTSGEFGFDFLRDRIHAVNATPGRKANFWDPWHGESATAGFEGFMQRSLHFALVDEADSIFVDDAKTPLIIGGRTVHANAGEQAVYNWADRVARQMIVDDHFHFNERKQKIILHEEGEKLIRYSDPPSGPASHALDKLHQHVERALHAHHRLVRDVNYVVMDNKVILVDEGTGRLQPDRHLRDGQHQAIEAKEGVAITTPTDPAAQITFQNYFRLYKRLAGMTGTAVENRRELHRIYKIWVVQIPTNRPCRREVYPDRVFPTESAKFDAVVDEVKRLHALGRPILIGTRSLERSELLSKRLNDAGIPHQVLNARPELAAQEAMIVAQAGRPATVTIATNMAGRGTDILLGGNPEYRAWELLREKYKTRLDVPPAVWLETVARIAEEEGIAEKRAAVVAAGGLHVLMTERHDNRRIDRQLQGRAGRQGDPGSTQAFLSLEDMLLEGLGVEDQTELIELGQRGGGRNWDKYLSTFLTAQRRIERRHYRQRRDLMNYHKRYEETLKDLGADLYVN